MGSIRDLTAADIVEETPVSVNVGQTLSKVRAKMEQDNLRAIPVVDGAQFAGMVGYRDLMEKARNDPSVTKVDAVMHQPPEIAEEQNLVELGGLRINSGRKKFALVDGRGRLQGTIGEEELVYPARNTDELKGVTVADLMTDDVMTVEADASHETARKIMQENNISRLPVLDDADELVGIITSNDLLRAMVPREQMAKGDYKADKDSLSDVPVSELMQGDDEYDALIIEDDGLAVAEAIDRLSRNNKKELVVAADDHPVGILTLKDVVDHTAGHAERERLRVDLTGPDVPEEKAAIMEKVETALQGSLGRILRRPDELKIHIKTYEKDGKRHKYSLNFKLSSAQGLTTVKTHGWDLLNAVDDGLDDLEKVVKKEQDKKRDTRREAERDGKYS
jgi:CBS domain-containing protein/ribosome-associated translation inhibitor RaiA